ncbi:hypothetical protein N9L68_04745 [bacterium]|nr:hypothetical protein [bacterium]
MKYEVQLRNAMQKHRDFMKAKNVMARDLHPEILRAFTLPGHEHGEDVLIARGVG